MKGKGKRQVIFISPMKKPKPKTVELVKSGYQPTKAEMFEEFTLRKPDCTAPAVEEIAQAVFQPASIRLIDKPRKRR